VAANIGVVHVERALSKADRQKLVLSLVGRRQLATQQDLLEALESSGCRVTQATVSRDIRELGLEKEVDPLGRLRYVAPGARRRDPRETLRSLLAQFGRGASAAQNIVVVHCEIGSAPAIARALDRVRHELVVGTLAGDDTLLVIARDSGAAAELAGDLG
jgi:transcriptional regulator of arginine metabolism